MEFTLMLRSIRKDARMTQSQLAEYVGVSTRIVGSWERGETSLTLEDAVKVSLALGCTPNDLCGWPKGKNEGRSFDDGLERELVQYYRESTPEQKDVIMMSARNAAGMSKEAAKRRALDDEGKAS